MLKVIIGFVTGEIFGFIIASLFKMSKDQEYLKKEKYRCTSNDMPECGSQCCLFCLGATECKYACQLHPGECGQAVKVH